MPNLKQLEEYHKRRGLNPSYKSTYIKANTIPERIQELDKAKREINQNLDQLKYNNFWAQPYSNLPGEQAVELGTNLIKESLYTGVGDALVNGLVSKVSKLIPKKTKRFKVRFEDNKPISKQDNVSIEEQKSAIIDNYNKIRENWNGDKNLDVTTTSKSGIDVLDLNPNIKRRLNETNVSYTLPPKFSVDLGNTNIYLGSQNKGVQLLGEENNLNSFYKYLKDYPDSKAGTFDRKNYNYDIYFKDNMNNIPISPDELGKIASHETTHQMQNLYKISYDKLTRIPKEELKHVKNNITSYYTPNLDLEISREIDKYLIKDPTNYWSRSINELHADLWKFRNVHNISSRDLTTQEINLFLEELGKRHFDMTKIDNNLIKWIGKLASLNVFSTKDKR